MFVYKYIYMDVEPKIGVGPFPPKWDGENNGSKPYFLMDDLGVPLFLETPIYMYIHPLLFESKALMVSINYGFHHDVPSGGFKQRSLLKFFEIGSQRDGPKEACTKNNGGVVWVVPFKLYKNIGVTKDHKKIWIMILIKLKLKQKLTTDTYTHILIRYVYIYIYA